ncbi:MAG: hypothetical protein ABIS20_18720 [Thermoanaerobaculia bacterium]
MTISRTTSFVAAAALLALAIFSPGLRAGQPAGPSASPSKDPLAAEIQRWSVFLRSDAASRGAWAQVKPGGLAVLSRAEQDLRDGRRLLALHRLAMTRVDLATAAYMSQRSAAQHREMAGFEAEWARMGTVMRDDLGTPSPSALSSVRPAALRALGEAALPQVRAYYKASLDYGHNTMPDEGLYYLGTAQAQRELAAVCRQLSVPSRLPAPPLRALRAEIEGLQSDLLKAYRPPASIDRHSAFITANAALNEARQLDAAGLRYGAMLRYLDAAQMIVPLRPPAPPLAPGELRRRLREFDARLSAGGIDHSIARMALEGAQGEVASAPPGTSPAASTAIVTDVLPRYFAALEPARPEAPKPRSQVTVTLVRWPYT